MESRRGVAEAWAPLLREIALKTYAIWCNLLSFKGKANPLRGQGPPRGQKRLPGSSGPAWLGALHPHVGSQWALMGCTHHPSRTAYSWVLPASGQGCQDSARS